MIEEIWRYPLKSARGESLQSLCFQRDGADGDRQWACLLPDGTVVSAKNPRRWGRLLQVSAWVGTGTDEGTVLVDVPDAGTVTAGTAEADGILGRWLGRAVHLTSEVPPAARLSRHWPEEAGMIPDWVSDTPPGSVVYTSVLGASPGGRFFDFGAVHVVTVRALEELRREIGEADVRRFRPNLVLSPAADLNPGDRIRLGSTLLLKITIPTMRCAIPGAEQPSLARRPELLRAIGRRRVDVPGRGRAACFGFYADVLVPGSVTVGDDAVVVSS